MNIVRVGKERFVNVDRMTSVEPGRKGRLIVNFGVGGGDVAGPSCQMVLDGEEAKAFRKWLQANSEEARSATGLRVGFDAAAPRARTR